MRRVMLFLVYVLVPLFLDGSTQCATVTIHTTDSVGAERISKVLIIIRSLEGRGEITRGLTDTSGILTISDVKPGLYEAISLYPYGYWSPAVREFVVDNENVSLQIQLNGSVRESVPASERRIAVKVVGSDGGSVKGATVLGRDLTARYLRFSLTDENGRATLTIPSGAGQIVVVHKGKITVQDVDTKAAVELHGGSTASAAEQAPLEIIIHIPSRASGDVKNR